VEDDRKANSEALIPSLAELDHGLLTRVELMRSAGRDPTDAFRGLYIELNQVDSDLHAMLQDGLKHLDSNPYRAMPILGARLTRLAGAFHLTALEVKALLAAAAPDLDPRYERIYAFVQDDVSRRRPSVDLLLQLFCRNPDERLAARALFAPEATLLDAGLVRLRPPYGDTTPSVLACALQPDERIVAYLLGSNDIDARLRTFATLISQPSADAFALDSDARHKLQAIEAMWRAGDHTPVVVTGRSGAGLEAAAGLLARRLGRPLLVVDCGELRTTDLSPSVAVELVHREAVLQSAVMCWSGADLLVSSGDDGITSSAAIAAMMAARWRGIGPTVLTAAPGWYGPKDHWAASFYRINLALPGAGARLAHWKRTVAAQPFPADTAALPDIAAGFRLTYGQIEDAVEVAVANARLSGVDKPSLTASHMRNGCRLVSGRALSRLAQEVEPRARWADIVLPADSLTQLRELCATVRQRAKVLDKWGFDKQAGSRGVTALFTGPPGTGKSLAAGIVAAELGLPLFRIDLSAIVSKWIGETEKNLDRVFQAAESDNGVLLFDEAEALFGKRSEVRDSHDRYANIEVSYLLQKMEHHEGVAILATNMRQMMDQAFLRRLSFTITFPVPEGPERVRIWKTLWPVELPRADDVDLQQLAVFKMTGGNVRNVLFAAAVLAADRGQVVTMAHLMHAVRREYQKVGKELSEQELAACALAEVGTVK
jgi:hypothetical protein